MKLNFFDKLYLKYYFLTKEDNTNSRYHRATYLMELVLTMLFSSIIFLFFGVFNIRIKNYFVWILLIALIGLLSYYLISKYYLWSNRYQMLLEKTDEFSRQRRFALEAFIIIIISFIFALFSAIGMGYLYSLH